MFKTKKHNLMMTIAGFFILILLAGVTYAWVIAPNVPNAPSLNIGPDGQTTNTPSGEVFSGPLAVSFQFFDHGNNDAVYTTANGTIKVLHADKTDFGSTTTGATVTGQVTEADNGKLWLLVQQASTVYVDKDVTTQKNTLLGSASPYQIGNSPYYYLFPIDVSGLTKETGFTTPITLNIYQYVADVTGLTYTSNLNATSASYSGTTGISASASGYISGMTQTNAFKIQKVELSMPDAANITMFDNGQINNIKVTLGLGNGASWSSSSYDHSTGGSYITFTTTVQDPTQEYYGVPVVYGIDDAATDIDYTVSATCSGFTASAEWVPTLTITVRGPDNVVTTISRPVSFVDT